MEHEVTKTTELIFRALLAQRVLPQFQVLNLTLDRKYLANLPRILVLDCAVAEVKLCQGLVVLDSATELL